MNNKSFQDAEFIEAVRAIPDCVQFKKDLEELFVLAAGLDNTSGIKSLFFQG